jgi:hypothetical protein
MSRRALPFLMVAAAIAAASGCTCNGDVSRFPIITPGGGSDGGSSDGGRLPDGGFPNPDGGNPCDIVFCPPPNPDGGFGGITDFPPPGGFNLDGGTGSSGDGVIVDPMGHITLNSQDIQLNYAWIANWRMGTVSKYDTRNLLPDGGIHEVGRYISVFPRNGLGKTNYNTTSASVFDPSRTAIDINGDMWVANFASHANEYFNVTKVAGSTFNCIDRNGNGKIDTSFDDPANAAPGAVYGVIDPNEYLNPSNPNDPLQYDECVLFTQELGAINPNGAFGEGSISISAGAEGGPGDVWVGTWIDRRVWRLDPFTGVPKPIAGGSSLPDGGGQYIPVPLIEPYGSAIDRKNRLWVVDRTRSNLTLIDTNTQALLSGKLSPPSGFSPTGGYGVAIDGNQRVWIAGWSSGAYAARYDPDAGDPTLGTWTSFKFDYLKTDDGGTVITRPRGVTVDDEGIVWMTSDSSNHGSAAMLWGFSADDGGVRAFPLSPGGATKLVDATSTWSKTSIGVGLDEAKNLWVNNSSGNVMRVARDTGQVITSANQAGALYTYSDFTGYQLRHFTVSQGFFRQTVAGCSRYAQWDTVSWVSSTPANTTISLYVRGSNNLDFSVSQRYGPFPTTPSGSGVIANLQQAPGPVPQFKYLQLEFLLNSTDGKSQPTLISFDVTSECLTPLQ